MPRKRKKHPAPPPTPPELIALMDHINKEAAKAGVHIKVQAHAIDPDKLPPPLKEMVNEMFRRLEAIHQTGSPHGFN